jgi:phage terminase large subunit-like protein
MCDPHGTGTADFRKEWMEYYERAPEPLSITITVDPGGLKDLQHSDPTAIVVVGVDVHNNWYILNRINMRLNPREIINTLFDLYEAYPKTHTIGIETVAWQRALRFFAQEEMRRRGKFLPILELRTDTRVSKPMRIRGLIPRFSNHTVFIRPFMKDLEDQLFKRSKNDDLVDALAYQLQVATRTPQPDVRLIDVVDPWSLEGMLMELAKKNAGYSPVLHRNLVNAYEDPQLRFRQMEDR